MTNLSDPEVPNLDQAKQNFKRIEQAGYEIQEFGQQLVRFGKAGQEQAQFLLQEIPKYSMVAKQYPSLQTSYESFKERIQLLMYGPSALPQSPVELSLIESEVSKFTDDNAFLNSIAHGGSSSTSSAVEFAMKSIDNLILLILRTRAQYHQ